VEVEVKANYPNAKIQLIQGGGGIFDVNINGKLIYSKRNMESPRFPNEGEISKIIKKEMG
jgi:selenoprotein W-related protein